MPRPSRLAIVLLTAALISPASADEPKSAPGTAVESKLKVGTQVGQRIPAFQGQLVDLSGKQVKTTPFDSHKTEKTTAYIFMSRTCPYCVAYQKRLQALTKTFTARGVQFVVVYPMRRTPEADKRAYHKSSGLTGAMINDRDASIARRLRIGKTPEVVLTARSGEILFRGGIDDSPWKADKVKHPRFQNAIEDTLAGRKVKVATSPTYG